MTGPTRRGIRGAIAASLAALPAMAASQPPASADADLLALCAEFHEVHEASYVPDEENWGEYLELRREIGAEIEAIRPSTDAGRLAVARVALVLMEEMGCEGSPHERLATLALRDICGRAGG